MENAGELCLKKTTNGNENINEKYENVPYLNHNIWLRTI